jgi:hypothetical protein
MLIVLRSSKEGAPFSARSTRNNLHPLAGGCLCDSDGTIKSG